MVGITGAVLSVTVLVLHDGVDASQAQLVRSIGRVADNYVSGGEVDVLSLHSDERSAVRDIQIQGIVVLNYIDISVAHLRYRVQCEKYIYAGRNNDKEYTYNNKQEFKRGKSFLFLHY